ncbi:MAG: glycosyltransferase [Bacteroidetes bacterium]|nr:glycosyltransferase [Bacteroidota bacterium]
MWAWLEILFVAYFAFCTFYSLLFSLGGHFYQNKSLKVEVEKKRLAVLIPAYKEDSVIVGTAISALEQKYPRKDFDVIVIADSLKEETLVALRKLPIIVHEVHFEKSTKVKSLQSALASYSNYHGVVILDADNIMQPSFLEKINSCFCIGCMAIQGQRTAKNKNTPMAILDGLSEAIANHINRKGAIALGLSSPIIGSGMAFQYTLLKNILSSMDSIGGFDKELQLRTLELGHKIHYIHEAVVLDEKVDSPEVFENQRKRWMSSHYIYLRKFLTKGILSLLKGNVSIFNIAVLYNLQLPRLMNLGIISISVFAAILLQSYLTVPIIVWLSLWMLYIISFVIAIPKSFLNKDILRALLTAPQTFITIFALHFKLKGANKKFIHTPHKQHS